MGTQLLASNSPNNDLALKATEPIRWRPQWSARSGKESSKGAPAESPTANGLPLEVPGPFARGCLTGWSTCTAPLLVLALAPGELSRGGLTKPSDGTASTSKPVTSALAAKLTSASRSSPSVATALSATALAVR